MPRPRKVSDETILRAAQRVMARRGADAFTLVEVAAEVGISRAAITLRFESAKQLRIRMAERGVTRLRAEMALAPATPSGDSLIALAALMGAMMPSPSTLILTAQRDVEDEALAPVALERREILRAAVAQRMPATRMAHDDAVSAFLMHLSGAMLTWPGEGRGSPSEYLAEQTKLWLRLAQISYSDVALDASLVRSAQQRTSYHQAEP